MTRAVSEAVAAEANTAIGILESVSLTALADLRALDPGSALMADRLAQLSLDAHIASQRLQHYVGVERVKDPQPGIEEYTLPVAVAALTDALGAGMEPDALRALICIGQVVNGMQRCGYFA